LFIAMSVNSEHRNQATKREAAKWLSGLTEIVAEDGTQRVLTGEKTTDAIIRQWEADDQE
jgi:hypothetical protein